MRSVLSRFKLHSPLDGREYLLLLTVPVKRLWRASVEPLSRIHIEFKIRPKPPLEPHQQMRTDVLLHGALDWDKAVECLPWPWKARLRLKLGLIPFSFGKPWEPWQAKDFDPTKKVWSKSEFQIPADWPKSHKPLGTKGCAQWTHYTDEKGKVIRSYSGLPERSITFTPDIGTLMA